MTHGQPAPGRSFVAGFVVLGVLLAFAVLLFLANFNDTASRPRSDAPIEDPFDIFDPGGKIKGKGKGKEIARIPDEALWVDGPPIERPAPPPGAKNVVLVILTAVRKDAIAPYGAPESHTPSLAGLARSGARFADTIAAAPYSRASGTALLTGQYAAALGLVSPGEGPEDRVLPESVETLAERMRAAGWSTLGVTANFNYNTDTGLAQGFDRYRNAQPNSFQPKARIEGERALREALSALDARSAEDAARPFYLQLDLVDAHSPLRRSPDLAARLDPDQPNVDYRTAVFRLDRVIQKLVEELDARGHTPASDTYLVVLSDHGEGNEDPPHHGKFHGHLLYETSVGVPWIVAGPDVPPGREILGLASQTDVMPTLLGLVGLAPPAGIEGRSWAGQLRGERPRTDRERAISDTWYFGTNRSSIWTETMACLKDFGSVPTEGQSAFADGCYDRTVDPEFRNLIADPALSAELEAWRAAVSAHIPPDPPSADGDAEEEGEGAG